LIAHFVNPTNDRYTQAEIRLVQTAASRIAGLRALAGRES
jgi:hypothetical protein